MGMSKAAQRAFGWDSKLRHAPQGIESDRAGFICPCRCGYPGRKSTGSPSAAYQHTRLHAENENAREAVGGRKVDFANGEKPPKAAPVVIPGALARPGSPAASPCGCGCGEASGGLFRPGHDSKLLARLLKEVNGGRVLAEAVAEMGKIGCSDKLQSKFIKRVNGASVIG